jgi:outer membrane protein
MKHKLSKFLAASLCTLFLTASVHAETKIGLIDLRKVFDNYYKTKQADANLKDEAGDLEKQIKEMVDDFKKGEGDWKKLLDKSNDQAVSSEERSNSKQAADKKLAELKELEQTVAQFQRSSKAKLTEKQRRKRDAILQEIRDAVNLKAKTSGYTLVLDVAAATINDTPVVMYNNGENDLTEQILTQLNASAPPLSKSTDEKAPAATEKK